MERLLPKSALAAWAAKLAPREIYAPMPEAGLWNHGPVTDLKSLRLDFTTTVQSPKRIIFPQREVLLDFGAAGAREHLPEVRPTVIFGVRPCDARALLLTDKVFGEPFPDPYYRIRREATALVGLACGVPPSRNCFCLSAGGSPHSAEGLDVLMTDLGDAWAVQAVTKLGRALMDPGGPLFKPLTDEDRGRLKAVLAAAGESIRRRVEITGALAGAFDSPLWEAAAAGCIRCGICTYLCPTCHCFDIADELETAAPPKGLRVRTWDTCQFPDFTMHSSGHNPRPHKAARLRRRILHKFLYFHRAKGSYLCTGCGRCISLCPVGIDLIDVLEEVKRHG